MSLEHARKITATTAAILLLGGCTTKGEFSVSEDLHNLNAVAITRGGELVSRIMCSQTVKGAIGDITYSSIDFRNPEEIDAMGLPNPCRKDQMIEPAEYPDVIRLAETLGWLH